MTFILSLLIFTASLSPDTFNFIGRFIPTQSSQRGRILGMLILAVIFLLAFTLYLQSKFSFLKHKFDLLVRGFGVEGIGPEEYVLENIKPIMLIIPAYNESDNLKTLLPSIPKKVCGLEVGCLVVDDCSSDDTYEVAKQHGCLVAHNIINRGQGATSRVGYDLLKKHHVRVGITMDADCQHDPAEMERLAKPILEDNYDLVMGSRKLGDYECDSTIRGLGVVILSFLVSLVSGVKLTDTSSGYKAFNMKRMGPLKLMEDQFQAAEVLIAASKAGLRIGEVPITIRNRACGESKKGPNWKYGALFCKSILKAWWR